MRVLHIYSGNLYGGIETLLVTLARYRTLCPAMEPHFGLCFDGRLSEELASVHASVHRLGEVRVSRPMSVLRARRSLSDLVRQIHFDVVVSHSPWALALLGPAARSNGLPLVLWLHNPTRGFHWVDGWARRIPPDLVLCNSRFTASSVAAIYPQVPTTWVYSPIGRPAGAQRDIDRSAVRAELDTSETAIVIVQASRLEAWKGHGLHLQALGLLRHSPGWVCWLVGGAQRPHEARYLEALKRTAAQLGIDERVRFVGERAEVPRFLAAADIYCQPNTEPEPFGIVFVEALWAGLPVVATDLGGAREIVDPSCGRLVPPGDPRVLAETVEHLIQNRSVRTALGTSGPARAARLCDPGTQLRSLHEALNHVVRQEVVA